MNLQKFKSNHMNTYQIQKTKRSIVVKVNGVEELTFTHSFEPKDSVSVAWFANVFTINCATLEEAFTAFKIEEANKRNERKNSNQMFLQNLSDFWKDVQGRVGMDVCTPFINKFKGHSFVAYDNGTVWSSTLKIAFNTQHGNSVSRNSLPKSCEELRGFGSDLSDLK